MNGSRVLAAVLVLALAPIAVQAAGEAWVLNEDSRTVAVVDTKNETVTASVDLDMDPLAGTPSGLAFSTAVGAPATYAFVGQGTFVHIITAGTRPALDSSFDLGGELGLATTVIDLAAAENRLFLDGGTPVVKSYLYVAADVVPVGSSEAEPYYVVIDQRALLGLKAAQIVVDSGPLNPSSVPPTERGDSVGVSVLGAPAGENFQRARYVIDVGGSTPKHREVILNKSRDLGPLWSVDPFVQERDSGVAVPEYFALANPRDRELPIVPTGTDGRLVHADSGDFCDLGGDMTQVSINGPGPGGYQIYAVDSSTEDLLRVDAHNCDTLAFPVGQSPSDIDVEAISGHGPALVTNRDSDDLTVVREDGAQATVPLCLAPPDTCHQGPVRVSSRQECGGCTIRDLQITQSGADDVLTWLPVGCPPGCDVAIYCQCASTAGGTCPCDCNVGDADCFPGFSPVSPTPPAVTAQAVPDPQPDPVLLILGPVPWKQLGVGVGPCLFVHTGAGAHDLRYVVAPIR